jgi:hypothetical protein
MVIEVEKAREQCEQLEKAWQILNDAAIELGSQTATLPPDIYISLRGVRDLIALCKSHPTVAHLTPGEIDKYEGFCVACCGSDVVARIKCELRNIEDMLVLRAMNDLGVNKTANSLTLWLVSFP